MKPIFLGDAILGPDELFVIAGPCVIEDPGLALEVALEVKRITGRLGLPYVFKSSFDKANRTSISSFRGPGLEEGLDILGRVKAEAGVAVICDIHTPDQAGVAAEVLDIIQIPAFLCRQTDLLVAAAETKRPINVKKGQFMAPQDMDQVIGKIRESGGQDILLTERGSSFGYHNLVVDMRSIKIMADFGWGVVFDATHSVQLPGGQGDKSGGDRSFVPTLARAAVAAGAHGLFIETHPDPDRALCDGPNSWPLAELESLLESLIKIKSAT